MLQTLQHHFKRILEPCLRLVKVGQLNGKVESENQLVRPVADSVRQIDKVSVHDEGFFSHGVFERGEAFEHLCHVHVVHFVDFDQVFEEHEHDVGKEARLFAEVSMLE